MFSIIIGEPYNLCVESWPEGCHFNYNCDGYWLHYMFPNPSQVEIDSVQQGPAEFGLFIEHPVIFLMHKFGDMLWNDAPYSWWMVSEERRHMPEPRSDIHALLRVVLLDSNTGIVKALRVLTFSAEFTHRFHQEVIYQSQMPWSQGRHDEVIQSVYRRYSPEEMALLSVIRCRGGE